MELQEVKQKRKEFLEDTWKYYAEDVSRRAIEGNKCKYKTEDGRKCAIGRHMTYDKYDPSIEGNGITLGGVAMLIPNDILNLGLDFLVRIQLLHDCNDNWNDHGLSDHGENVVGEIERDFIL